MKRFLSSSAAESLVGITPPLAPYPKGIMGSLIGHPAALFFDNSIKGTAGQKMNTKKLDWYKETNSKVAMVSMFGQRMIFCSDPAIYREVFVDKQASFTNSNVFRDVFGHLFPKSMIVLEGDDWKRIRGIAQRALNKVDLNAVIKDSAEVLTSAIGESLIVGKEVDTYQLFSFISFDIFHKVMYNYDPQTVTLNKSNPNIKLLQECEVVINSITDRAFSRHIKFAWDMPTPANRKLWKALDYVRGFSEHLVEERRKFFKDQANVEATQKTRTVIDALVLSQLQDNLANDELNDQIATFFFGAFETTSNTLTFLLNDIAANPEIQDKLRKAIKEKFPGGREDILKATLEDFDTVDYLVWCINESFRLTPIATMLTRDVVKDVVVGGYQLKKGDSVFVDHTTVSRDDKYFDGQTDLNKFNPERFKGFSMDKLHSLPFGFGARICPGRRIANAEIRVLTSLLLSDYRILLSEDPSKRIQYNTYLGLACEKGTGFLKFEKL
jgi:cytochrome P450